MTDFNEMCTLTTAGKPALRVPLAEAVALVIEDWASVYQAAAVIYFEDDRPGLRLLEIMAIHDQPDFPKGGGRAQ